MKLVRNSDNELTVVATDSDGSALAGATVQATVYDRDESAEIAGTAMPITAAETETAGTYSCVLPKDLSLDDVFEVVVVVTIDGGASKYQTLKQRVFVEDEDFNPND